MIAHSAWLIPAFPGLAAGIQLLFGPRLGYRGSWLAVGATGVSAGLALAQLVAAHAHPDRVTVASHRLASLGSLSVSASTSVDGLAAVMCVVVTSVALLVQLYSTAYMAPDSRYSSYASFVSLFTAAMLVVVLAGDLVWLLVGWEVMGICSYLLIGHHWEDRPNTDAAISAFLVTRFGDLGFTAGIAVFAVGAGSTSIPTVLHAHYSHTTVVVGSLLVLMGVIGKSAQFPLQTWLPDAMAGPTPVSALIHAATMVAAGVYVVARTAPVVLSTTVACDVLAVIACITMMFGAVCAFAQSDLKRVLAWSTVSQLAYMYAGLAVGRPVSAIGHLVTHAGFKALLFLAAGCIAHAVGSTSMDRMGGLRNGMPIAFSTMTIGLAALGGFPLLSGFVSKDGVLEGAWSGRNGGHVVSGWVAQTVAIVGLATAALTAAYCMRVWLRLFAGPRKPEVVAHDAPWPMSVAVLILALPALSTGLLLSHGWLERLMGQPGSAQLAVNSSWALLSTGCALAGTAVSYGLWRAEPSRDPAAALGSAQAWLRDGMGIGEFYLKVFVRPVRDRLATVTASIDRGVIDAAVVGVGRSAVGAGSVLRRTQTGNVQLYLTVLVVGLLGLAIGAVAL